MKQSIYIYNNGTLKRHDNTIQFITEDGVKRDLPIENISVPGVYYFIFQRLAWEGIVLNEVISTTNEFTIIVSDDYVDKAFRVIKDLKNV